MSIIFKFHFSYRVLKLLHTLINISIKYRPWAKAMPSNFLLCSYFSLGINTHTFSATNWVSGKVHPLAGWLSEWSTHFSDIIYGRWVGEPACSEKTLVILKYLFHVRATAFSLNFYLLKKPAFWLSQPASRACSKNSSK